MKKLFAVATLALAASQLSAQQLAQHTNEVVSPGGIYYESPSNDITLSATVGELIMTTVDGGGIILTQGFQQPNLPGDVTSIETYTAQGIDMQAYPNPFTTEFFAVINLDKTDKLVFTLTDITGKTLNFSQQVSHPQGKAVYTFNTTTLAQGLYHLTVRNESGSITKTLKISKID